MAGPEVWPTEDVSFWYYCAIYKEVGFARSLLAYELPDGRLKLIDGHLRRDLDRTCWSTSQSWT